MATDLPGFSKKLNALADSLTSDTKKLLNQVGMEGKSNTTAAVKGDLGDTSMSNWRRGRPIQVGVKYDIVSATSVEFAPTPRSSGPMRVLEEGRRAGVSKGRKRQGRVGATAGRGTWTAATQKMEKELPRIVHQHTVVTLRKLFG